MKKNCGKAFLLFFGAAFTLTGAQTYGHPHRARAMNNSMLTASDHTLQLLEGIVLDTAEKCFLEIKELKKTNVLEDPNYIQGSFTGKIQVLLGIPNKPTDGYAARVLIEVNPRAVSRKVVGKCSRMSPTAFLLQNENHKAIQLLCSSDALGTVRPGAASDGKDVFVADEQRPVNFAETGTKTQAIRWVITYTEGMKRDAEIFVANLDYRLLSKLVPQ